MEEEPYLIIYKATNKINGKVYIGQTTNSLEHRKNQHLRETNSRRKDYGIFHDAIKEYGFDAFTFQAIDTAESLDELDEKERYWISYYKSDNFKYGYNQDSGGRKGGTKSDKTKRLIGDTTLEKWKNPETARRMRDGLTKGAETMKNNAKRYPFTCPVCGKTFYYAKHVAEQKKYCSLKCAANDFSWVKGVANSAIASHEKNLERKEIIKRDIIQWARDNSEIVINCPYNKISTTLTGLSSLLQNKYNIKDFRSIFICFNVKNLKSLLIELKKLICDPNENVC